MQHITGYTTGTHTLFFPLRPTSPPPNPSKYIKVVVGFILVEAKSGL
jgi:hypothetical protein